MVAFDQQIFCYLSLVPLSGMVEMDIGSLNINLVFHQELGQQTTSDDIIVEGSPVYKVLQLLNRVRCYPARRLLSLGRI